MLSHLLIRYGIMRFVGWFSADSRHYEVGDRVVIQTRRGRELGEVLALETPAEAVRTTTTLVLRKASPADLDRADQAANDQPRRLAVCETVFGEGQWPFDLIDVEPLLDEAATVLYYLGPHHLDADGLRQALRERYALEVVFEPVGTDEPAQADDHFGNPGGCGSCGSSGGGCGSGESGGCGSCGVKDLVARRRAILNR